MGNMPRKPRRKVFQAARAANGIFEDGQSNLRVTRDSLSFPRRKKKRNAEYLFRSNRHVNRSTKRARSTAATFPDVSRKHDIFIVLIVNVYRKGTSAREGR